MHYCGVWGDATAAWQLAGRHPGECCMFPYEVLALKHSHLPFWVEHECNVCLPGPLAGARAAPSLPCNHD